MPWWWGYTETVLPRPPRLHRISTNRLGCAVDRRLQVFPHRQQVSSPIRPPIPVPPNISPRLASIPLNGSPARGFDPLALLLQRLLHFRGPRFGLVFLLHGLVVLLVRHRRCSLDLSPHLC